MKRLLALGLIGVAVGTIGGCAWGTEHTKVERVAPIQFTICHYETGFGIEDVCIQGTPREFNQTCSTIGRAIQEIREMHGGETLVICGPLLRRRSRAAGPHGPPQYLPTQ